MDYFKLKKINAILEEVNAWAEEIAGLTDQALQAKTYEFQERYVKGESLDDLLPEAFAVVREADKRVLGMYPYDVQVMGGIVLHQGDVAEMNTGEGKTLTATMPVYLNALTGEGVAVVTTNEYLAVRDAAEMGQVYRFLGLSVGVPVVEEGGKELTKCDKKKIYQSDVLYTTHSALGFDYLIENLSDSRAGQFFRQVAYVIIDEIDAILLDSAQTPLVISGAPRVQSNLFGLIDTLVTTLEEERHFKYDAEKKRVWLTLQGVKAAEDFLGVDNLYETVNKEIVRHINLALRAHKVFLRDKDYVVKKNSKGEEEVMLLDAQTGRLMEMTRLQGGLHQAIEAKEHVKLTSETRAMASITYQNFFKMYQKLGGMTGTGKVAEEEFLETYGMSVIQIPTNRPKIREDLPDNLYRTLPEKVFASLDYIKEYHVKGNPILIFTGSVEMSIIYSNLLLREGIAHNLLNANNAAREAQIISESGQLGAVTVATSMAGRGTDIKLGPGVSELGGLVVIGTERMMNQRIDLQIRGRSGRQGDPGMSKFFISLEDDVVKTWGPSWVQKYYHDYDVAEVQQEPQPLLQRKFRNIIEKAQSSSESAGRMARRMTLEYAQSMNIQRDMVYRERAVLIEKEENLSQVVEKVLKEVVNELLDSGEVSTPVQLYRYILDNMDYHLETLPQDLNFKKRQVLESYLMEVAQKSLEDKYQQLKESALIAQFQRVAILKAIDENWIEQVDYLQQLRTALSGQYNSQKNPLVEYYQEAYEAFDRMKVQAKRQMIRNLLLSTVEVNKKGEVVLHFP